MPKRNDRPNGYYSYLLVDKSRRRQLIFLTVLCVIAMTALIDYGVMKEKPWLMIALCSVLIGLPVMALPKSENWAYEPWQAEPQKLEQHFRK